MDKNFNRMTGVYTTLLGFHDAQKVDFVNLNGGYLMQIHGDKQSPFFQVGLRLDNLLARARSSQWGQAHTTLSPLPSIEFGPFISAWGEKVDSKLRAHVIYGLGIALKL